MVLWIGLDDTDSLRGMCTTFLATELVRELSTDLDLIGYPRIVRLNPNVPWKTRGNGALCVRFGRGRGEATLIGEIAGRSILSFPRSAGDDDPRSVVGRIERLVERWACFEDPTTNPAFVVFRRPPTARLYWRAVRRIISKEEALDAGRGLGLVREYKEGRGVIGATAATAWHPHDRTYEVLAYRHPIAWGTPRQVDPESVRRMDRAFPSTFNNYDHENARIVIAPRSPCPVLLGIRGDHVKDLVGALRTVRSEPADRWLIFETNQGTDDHVISALPIEPSTTVDFRGDVTRGPRTITGGHLIFSVDGYEVTAYEPSKQFREKVGSLFPEDRVRVIGSVRDSPRTVNLEKVQVLHLAEVTRKIANPTCPQCGKRMKSMGRAAPYRCARCGVRWPRSAEARESVPRRLSLGWYEPPVGSRRHLSKPLQRMADLVPSEKTSLEPARFRVPESDISLRSIGRLSRS